MKLPISIKFNIAMVVYILFCIPMILLSEQGLIPLSQKFFHISQFIAVVACFFTGCLFILKNRKASTPLKVYAVTSISLSAAWIGFVIFVILSLNFSPID